ncbi:MAG: alpha-galactosidase [Lachnospiraceae bacterium]|jgi:alpha-galactosidase|nr:alpha-galactosidase [Lachnospiraceae bacterium]MCH4071066.1 alpha-galactosidase [Lachnospiraceae bacterium]MCH4108137.1 alpha-galactosidase [Lachnospiraceae bacterium]MCI1302839.1 alpha-galactosidase [Lachnospiraceae bacterium]MCI1332088.1 alpha-galactosidase [Lachnospiraceae bacterium]
MDENFVSVNWMSPDYWEIQDTRGTFHGTDGNFKDASVRLVQEKDGGVTVRVQASCPLSAVRLRWNCEDLIRGKKIFGDAWERGYGDMEWGGVSAARILPWYFLILSEKEKKVLGIGVKVRPSAFCFWQADTSGISLYMDVRCGGEGVVLGGRTLSVCTIVSREYVDLSALEAGRKFCRMMCPDPILPDTPVYGSNNWYYAYGNSSQEAILQDTELLAQLTSGNANRPYMVIDDGWQKERKPEGTYIGGPWREGNSRFPDMQALAGEIRRRGAIPGIWLRPLLNDSPEIPASWKLSCRDCLDPTVPEALAFVREDIRTLCENGYRLIKHDFSTFDLTGKWGFEMHPLVTDRGWHFADRSCTTAEAVILLYKAILQAAAPYGALILGCNTVGHLGAGLMHMDRVGDDTSGIGWERTRSVGVNTLAFRLMQHDTFFAVDADCVGITGKIAWEQNRQWAEAVARSGTALFLSVKPGVLTDAQMRELSQIMAMASRGEHHAVPLDWTENTCPDLWQDGEEVIRYHWYPAAGVTFAPDRNLYTARLTDY